MSSMRNGLSKQSSLPPILQWGSRKSRFEHSKSVNGSSMLLRCFVHELNFFTLSNELFMLSLSFAC